MKKRQPRTDVDPQEIDRYMGLVRKVLKQRAGNTTYQRWARNQGITDEELETSAVAALWKALSKFDPASEGDFEAYAATVIGNDLKKFIKKNGRSNPAPPDKAKKYARLSQAVRELAEEGHACANDEQLAAWAGVNIDDVKEWRQHLKHERTISINTPLAGSRPEEGKLADLLEDEAELPDVEAVSFDAVFARAELTAEEESVIRLRWGLDGVEDPVLKLRPRPRALVAEILTARKRGARAPKYNTERVRLLEKKATGKLAKLLDKADSSVR